MERRIVTSPQLEVREADGGVSLSGYAAVFNSEERGEVVMPSAFNKTLAERDDVRLLVNHDGVPLARTKSGTLDLSVDEVGLRVDAPAMDPANPTVQELTSAMRRQDIDQMSFGFTVTRDDTNDRGVRELIEVRLWDVSVVTFPWYTETSAELRDIDRALLSLHRGEPLTVEQRQIIMSAVGEVEQEPEEPPVDLASAHAARRRRLELLEKQIA